MRALCLFISLIVVFLFACQKKLTITPLEDDEHCKRLNYAETVQFGETTITSECSIIHCTDPATTPQEDQLSLARCSAP